MTRVVLSGVVSTLLNRAEEASRVHETVILEESDARSRIDAFLDRLVEAVGTRDIQLVGIHRRGDVLAARLRDRIESRTGRTPELGVLDITLYRDDFTPDRPQPTVRPSQIPFEIDGTEILLVDDVFQTGRTIRAALTQLADFGRPRRVELAVFVERDARELPIRPDYVGITVDRSRGESVQLQLAEVDGHDRLVARERESSAEDER